MADDATFKPFYANSYALVIGVNTYQDPSFVPLGEAEDDAQRVAELLEAQPYNFKVRLILGEEAIQQNILQAMYDLRSTGPDDRVLVYFAGHGYTLSDRLGKETGFLAMHDTVPQQDFTALPTDTVTSLRRHAAAKHVGFIFDACFSGQALGLTRAPAVLADKYLTRRAYQVISAGAGDQTVSDFESMTDYLIDALERGLPDSPDLVTLGGMGLHLQQALAMDSGQMQIPQFGHLQGSQGGDLILLQGEGSALPAEIETALRSELGAVRLGAVAALIDMANGSLPTLAKEARQRLTEIVEQDPDERVRERAEVYFLQRGLTPGVDPLTEDEELSALADIVRGRASRPEMAKAEAAASEDEAVTLDDRIARALENISEQRFSDTYIPPDKGSPPQTEPEPVEDAAPPPLQEAEEVTTGPALGILLAGGAVVTLVVLLLLAGAITRFGQQSAVPPAETPTTAAAEPPPTPTTAEEEDAAVVPPVEETPAPTATPLPPPPGGGGQNVAFVAGDGSLTLVDLVTGSVDDLGIIAEGSIAWSPDGERLAYASPADGDTEIVVLTVATGETQQLTDNLFIDDSPAWSPDGDTLVYVSTIRGFRDLYTISADGSSEPFQITLNEANDRPSWSPDGGLIAYEGILSAVGEVYAVPAVGGARIDIATEDEGAFRPNWSPDGDRIAFYSVQDGNREIYTISRAGTNRVRLTQNRLLRDQDPRWSPDGSQILYIQQEDDGTNSEVWIMAADGSDQTFLAPGESAVWSPDGSMVAAVSGGTLSLIDVETGESTVLAEGVSGPVIWQP